jgi:siroheme synthase (precorrin-2 oxidase/ferrochelatase)
MEIKIYMEKEVENEYKNNLAQIRNEILEKNKEMEKYRADTDKLMEELRTHQLQKKHDDFK